MGANSKGRDTRDMIEMLKTREWMCMWIAVGAFSTTPPQCSCRFVAYKFVWVMVADTQEALFPAMVDNEIDQALSVLRNNW